MEGHDIARTPLLPGAFLDRAARVHPDRPAVVHAGRTRTYRELHDDIGRLAGALAARGVAVGDRVAVLSRNTPLALESVFAVPASGAVLVALNTRLSGRELAAIVDHAGCSVLLCEDGMLALGLEVAASAVSHLAVVAADSSEFAAEREAAAPLRHRADDELGLLALNYTSGTTGAPKGVMYHHRGAYLQALAMAMQGRLDVRSVFLWTLPLFHCNGWCFPWAVTAVGATHVCLAEVDPAEIWRLVDAHGVTHLNAAPTVLVSLLEHPAAGARAAGAPRIRVATGGAPPPPALLARADAAGLDIVHLYGLTETFGPAVICEWRPEWDGADAPTRARLLSRQGVANVLASEVVVIDDSGHPVPEDGATMGEIRIRGANVALGYYRDEIATEEAMGDGWFRTGDLAIVHPDGYLEIRDRAKDIIISGGENISSIEVEHALLEHPSVRDVAVVAAPDERWGEVPVAVVELRDGCEAGEEELRDHVRTRLARFKAPKRVLFEPLPRTATGKIQKHVLRGRVRDRDQAIT